MSLRNLELMVDRRHGRLTAAVMRRDGLYDLYIDGGDVTASWASIYQGKVAKIDRALDAAIVDLGNGLQGFLPAKHARSFVPDRNEKRPDITELLKPGQSLLVQIKSEAKRGSRHEQAKMPRLTAKVTLMGQYAQHTPLSPKVLMSRRIARPDVLETITAIKQGSDGFLMQAQCDLAACDDLIREVEVLPRLWQAISATGGGDEPRLLQAGPNAMERALIDYGSAAFDHIYVADKDILGMMQDWCALHQPDLAQSKRLRLFKPEKLGQKLFDIHEIDGAIEDLRDGAVALPSGGGIIIEYTHAMVVVDVNQGSCTNILTANLEAAREVARQMRLRNLSGAILVDFINMNHRTERAEVLDALEKALAHDGATSLVHGFTRVGIVEITRKRRTGMLVEKSGPAADHTVQAFNKSA